MRQHHRSARSHTHIRILALRHGLPGGDQTAAPAARDPVSDEPQASADHDPARASAQEILTWVFGSRRRRPAKPRLLQKKPRRLRKLRGATLQPKIAEWLVTGRHAGPRRGEPPVVSRPPAAPQHEVDVAAASPWEALRSVVATVGR
jgi:hypothetical protein